MVLSIHGESHDEDKETECAFIDRKIKEYPAELYPIIVKRLCQLSADDTFRYLKQLKEQDDDGEDDQTNYTYWWKKLCVRMWLYGVQGELDEAQRVLDTLKEIMSEVTVHMMDESLEIECMIKNNKGEVECKNEGAILETLNDWSRDLKKAELLLNYANQK